jgi:hypothetical protein
MTYVYEILDASGSAAGVFEVEQGAGDPPLHTHPLTGQPVRLIHQPPYLAGQHNERRVRTQLNDSQKLEKLGFTRYEKDRASGHYHKTAGADTRAPEIF